MWYVLDVEASTVVFAAKTRRSAYDANRNLRWMNPLRKYRVEHAS